MAYTTRVNISVSIDLSSQSRSYKFYSTNHILHFYQFPQLEQYSLHELALSDGCVHSGQEMTSKESNFCNSIFDSYIVSRPYFNFGTKKLFHIYLFISTLNPGKDIPQLLRLLYDLRHFIILLLTCGLE